MLEEPGTYHAGSRRSEVPLTIFFVIISSALKIRKPTANNILRSQRKTPLKITLKLIADLENPMQIKYSPSFAFSIAYQHSTTNIAAISERWKSNGAFGAAFLCDGVLVRSNIYCRITPVN